MLKTVDILNSLGEKENKKYGEMIKQVNLPDFYKCIAQFSGLRMNNINDDAIIEYLTIWAKNKYRFWLMLDNQLRKDTKFTYRKTRDNIEDEIEPLKKEYPMYYPWLDMFVSQTSNIIDMREFGYGQIRNIEKYFPKYNLNGSKITHFFKSLLNAPEKLIIEIGRVFECDTMDSFYTISIDPVDMMLASENPYNWESCYRLELDNDESHADGCLAAVLDTSSLITYIWDKEGEFKLYDKFFFKNIRWKKMRGWIAINKEMNAIHFNDVYPRKDYDFDNELRAIVEELVCQVTNRCNMWKRNGSYAYSIERQYGYGYSEYSGSSIYLLSDDYKEDTPRKIWKVFDERIKSPDGYGYLPGSYNDDDRYEYNGQGFIASNFEEEGYWCEWNDDYCSYGYDDCYSCGEVECWAYRQHHLVCDQTGDECEHVDEIDSNEMEVTYDNYAVPCAESCHMCQHFQDHFPREYDEWKAKQEEKEKEKIAEAPVEESPSETTSSNEPVAAYAKYVTKYPITTTFEVPNQLQLAIDNSLAQIGLATQNQVYDAIVNGKWEINGSSANSTTIERE